MTPRPFLPPRSHATRPLRGAWLPSAVLAGALLAVVALATAPVRAGEFSHAAFDTVLAACLHDGRVDYGGLAREHGALDRYLAATRLARPEGWPRDEQIAFWVNTYNARVLEGVIRRPKLKSVLDVGKAVGVPTLGFFRERGMSAGRKLSLNDVEHEILRKRFRDARVHFVLNCASASCPDLPPRALRAATLDATLDAATRRFLADAGKNSFAPASDVRVSSIFKWYRQDFEAAAGSLPAFLERYGPNGIRVPADATIRFRDYDWSLNGHW